MIVAGPCIPKQYAISSIRSLLADVVRHKYQRQKYATTTIRHGPRNDTFRLAVIGSGPAGFYTSYKILSKIETSFVDMYERLPVPFGLVRYGVAPDHPEVKVCFFISTTCPKQFPNNYQLLFILKSRTV